MRHEQKITPAPSGSENKFNPPHWKKNQPSPIFPTTLPLPVLNGHSLRIGYMFSLQTKLFYKWHFLFYYAQFVEYFTHNDLTNPSLI